MSDEEKPRNRLRWLDPNQSRVPRSKKQEQRISKEMGGRREPRSGGLPFSSWESGTAGRDISSPKFSIEHKMTEKQSISLKKEWLDKIKSTARSCGKDPMLVITFMDGAKPAEDWVVIPLSLLKRLSGSED